MVAYLGWAGGSVYRHQVRIMTPRFVFECAIAILLLAAISFYVARPDAPERDVLGNPPPSFTGGATW